MLVVGRDGRRIECLLVGEISCDEFTGAYDLDAVFKILCDDGSIVTVDGWAATTIVLDEPTIQ